MDLFYEVDDGGGGDYDGDDDNDDDDSNYDGDDGDDDDVLGTQVDGDVPMGGRWRLGSRWPEI